MGLRRLEHDVLVGALDEHVGNVSATARDLGITREALRLRAKRVSLVRRPTVAKYQSVPPPDLPERG